PNFSCSVPMRQSPRGFSPEARTATSWSRRVTGLSPAWLGLDMRIALGKGAIRDRPAFAGALWNAGAGHGIPALERRHPIGAGMRSPAAAAAYEFIAWRIAAAPVPPLASAAPLPPGNPHDASGLAAVPAAVFAAAAGGHRGAGG